MFYEFSKQKLLTDTSIRSYLISKLTVKDSFVYSEHDITSNIDKGGRRNISNPLQREEGKINYNTEQILLLSSLCTCDRCRMEEENTVRDRSDGNYIFQIQEDQCTYELTEIMPTCRRPA